MLSTTVRRKCFVNISRNYKRHNDTTNVDNRLPPEPPEQGVSLRPSTSKKCCGMVAEYKYRYEEARRMFLHHRCWCWNCPRCGPTLRREWLMHLSAKMLEAPNIYVFHLDSGEWRNKYQQRMSRSKANFARIEQNDGSLTVFCTDSKQGEKVPTELVLTQLEQALDTITFKYKPIYTSVGWYKGKNGRPEGNPDWEFVRHIPATIEKVKSVMESLNLEIKSFQDCSGGGLNGFHVTLPRCYFDNNGKGIAILYRWLAWVSQNGVVRESSERN